MVDFIPGSTTIASLDTETDLFDVTNDKYFASWIFTNTMQTGDVIVITAYIKDEQGDTLRKYDTRTLRNSQADPAFFIPSTPTRQYKVTIQQTAGTLRTFNWQRIEQ